MTLSRGATGARVRELHHRLAALGLTTGDDPERYGDATVALVESFQRSRGLPITGEVDATTWARLEEADWRLGARLLYLTRPNLRGDDVAELQTRLAQLGFDPGRVDGILGPQSERALAEFQRNCGLADDGTLTRATLVELLRLSSFGGERALVTEARAQAGLDEPALGPIALYGASPLVGLVAAALAGAHEVLELTGSPEAAAAAANRGGAALVLSFQVRDDLPDLHLHYWASYRSHSPQGQRLAGRLAAALAAAGVPAAVEVTGMALPILRETRMTTLHVEHGPAAPGLLTLVAGVIARVIHS